MMDGQRPVKHARLSLRRMSGRLVPEKRKITANGQRRFGSPKPSILAILYSTNEVQFGWAIHLNGHLTMSSGGTSPFSLADAAASNFSARRRNFWRTPRLFAPAAKARARLAFCRNSSEEFVICLLTPEITTQKTGEGFNGGRSACCLQGLLQTRPISPGGRAATEPGRQTPESWLGRQDSNLGMAESKSAALPLGYAPTTGGHHILARLASRNDPWSSRFGASASPSPARTSDRNRGAISPSIHLPRATGFWRVQALAERGARRS